MNRQTPAYSIHPPVTPYGRHEAISILSLVDPGAQAMIMNIFWLFWQKYEFQNQGLKKKILQTIREAWLTSFPKIPLPMPAHEDTSLIKQIDTHSLLNDVPEDATLVNQADSQAVVNPHHEAGAPIKQIDSHSLMNDVPEDATLVNQADSQALADPDHEDTALGKQATSHFSQGLELGFSGRYHEAIDELSKAIGENPDPAVAHTSLGVVFHRLGEDDRALSCYAAALQIDLCWLLSSSARI